MKFACSILLWLLLFSGVVGQGHDHLSEPHAWGDTCQVSSGLREGGDDEEECQRTEVIDTESIMKLSGCEGMVGVKSYRILSADRVHIGYRVFANQPVGQSTVFIAPGYTGTSAQFMCWFADYFKEIGMNVVTMDYRGFGLSTGQYGAKVGPDENVYRGLSLANLATDAYKIIRCGLSDLQIKRENLLLLGHSYGNMVWYQFLSMFGDNFMGFANIDQVPKFTSHFPMANNPSYPSCSAVPPCVDGAKLGDIAKGMSERGKDFRESAGKNGHYPVTAASYEAFFYSCEAFHECRRDANMPKCHGIDLNVTVPACMTETEEGLRAWKAGTNNFKDINGKLDAILMWNDVTADFTSEITGEGMKLPLFVYGGEYSLVPFNLMKWVYANSKSYNKSHLWLFGTEGNHTPFLNKGTSRQVFFDKLIDWVVSLCRNKGTCSPEGINRFL